MSLTETNIKLLQKTNTPMSVFAEAVGCNVSWIYRYKNNELGDPGTSKSEKLYYALTGKTLRLVKV